MLLKSDRCSKCTFLCQFFGYLLFVTSHFIVSPEERLHHSDENMGIKSHWLMVTNAKATWKLCERLLV